jgi:transcription elongation factor Elf1
MRERPKMRAIVKQFACPVCGLEHEVLLSENERCKRGLILCGGVKGDWCNTHIAYELSRDVTWTAQVSMYKQNSPNLYRLAKEGEGE